MYTTRSNDKPLHVDSFHSGVVAKILYATISPGHLQKKVFLFVSLNESLPSLRMVEKAYVFMGIIQSLGVTSNPQYNISHLGTLYLVAFS